MAENQVKITYHIYLEAEDVSQSRILSSTSYVKNLFKNCGNHYFQGVDFDDESDLDDFTLRLFVEQEILEEECSVEADAKDFPADMASALYRRLRGNQIFCHGILPSFFCLDLL